MAPPREIPGFYYDEVKRKYFRIEDSKKTVLPDGAAAWRSEGEVKRRKKEVEEARGEREWRERVERERVRRVDVGWMVNREIKEGERDGEGMVREWAGGLQDKGKIKMWQNWGEENGAMIDCLFVEDHKKIKDFPRQWDDEGGEERFAWVCAGLDDMGVAIAAAPLDEDGKVDYASKRVQRGWWPSRYFDITIPYDAHIVGIKVSKGPRVKSLLAFGNTMSSDSLPIVRCYVGEPHGPETWPVPKQWIDLSHNYVNAGACTPLENSSHFVLGTRRGVYQSVHDEFLHDLDTRPRPHGWRTGRTDSQPPFRGDVLAVDYLQECPQVVLAGTRSGHICQLDLRTPAKEWESKVFRHKSSVAHIKAVGPYNILAAGPRNAMCIYDIRFTRAREQKANQKPFRPWEQHAVAPAVEFPGYRNDAYIKIGLDVLNEPGYGHGVVAAAHDDCTVGLYSVRDGSRISSPDVDKIKARGVIKAMMFQTLPDDQHPSLFVGVGPVVQKFSF